MTNTASRMLQCINVFRKFDLWMRDKVAISIAAKFPQSSPQHVGLDFVYAAAVIMIIRALGTVLFISGSWLEDTDLLATMLIGLGILGFVIRRRFLANSMVEVKAGRLPLQSSFGSRMGWTGLTILLLVFNLFCFFPGDIYYTMDIAVFFLIAMASYLQGIPQQEVHDSLATGVCRG